MHQPPQSAYVSHRMHAAGGFTLLEVLAALAVMSVASYILIGLFMASLQVGEGARLHDTAAAIASEQMQALVNGPEAFVWPAFVEDGIAVEVLPAHEADEWHAPATPDAMPSVRASFERESIYHQRFGWRAYARPLADAPNLVEVLTSALPRTRVPEAGDAA